MTAGRTPAEFFDHLKRVGFYPATIIDVGVAKGTPDIYEAYPDAYYVLVDPVAEYEQDIRNLLRGLRGEFHACALSDSEGAREMMIQEPFYVSTFQFNRDEIRNPDAIRSVPMTTLDRLISEGDYAGPIMVKTDCQGHDLHVIRGASASLERIDVIICEIPVYGPWGGGPEFTDYVRVLDELGYRFYDVWGTLYRTGDKRLQNLDLVFVKTDGQLRQNRLYPQGELNLGHFARSYES